MISHDFYDKASKLREIHDNNGRNIPDILTVLKLLHITPKSYQQFGDYRDAYIQICKGDYYCSDSPKRKMA